MQQKPSLSSHGVKSLRVALRALHERGIPAADCLAGTGVAEEDLYRSELRVSLQQEFVFYRNVIRLTRDPLIGLAIGAQYHLPNYGIWGYAVMSAPCLEEALRLAFRFIGLTYTCHDITLHTAEKDACMKLVPLRDYGDCTQVITDRDTSALYLIVSELLGRPLPLERLDLLHEARDFADQYRAYFQCPVAFGTPCSALYVAHSALTSDLPHSDPHTTRMSEYQCEVLQSAINSGSEIVTEIRQLLLETPGQFPQIEQAARRMNLSERNLRRLLNKAGQSYTQILNDLRYELARQYLDVTPLTVKEIARTLGYSEPGNFSHAPIVYKPGNKRHCVANSSRPHPP